MKVITYTQDDTVYIVAPVLGHTVDTLDLSRVIPEGVSHKVIDDSELPSRVLRDAWIDNSSSIDINLEKGKRIATTKRRAVRDETFKDISAAEKTAYMRDVDDVAQASIEAATNEADLLTVIDSL
jgi:hypothetical protein